MKTKAQILVLESLWVKAASHEGHSFLSNTMNRKSGLDVLSESLQRMVILELEADVEKLSSRSF